MKPTVKFSVKKSDPKENGENQVFIEEEISIVLQPDIQQEEQNAYPSQDETIHSRSESLISEDSEYSSSEDPDDDEGDVLLTKDLQDPGSLKDAYPSQEKTVHSRSESLNSEDSEYSSSEGPDDDEGDVLLIKDLEDPGFLKDAYLSKEETVHSRSESPNSEDSSYYSCESDDDVEGVVLLTKEQKHIFSGILKDLLEYPGSLKNGHEGEDWHDGKILKLMYMTQRCQVSILDARRRLLFRETVLTREIYFKWCTNEHTELLCMENLQKVWNELKAFGILNEKVDACFSKAINEFMAEFECVQKNTTLKLICDDILLTFVSGAGKNVATVTYDDCKNNPKYGMNAAWYMILPRFLQAVWHKICEWTDAFLQFLVVITSLLRNLTVWIRSCLQKQKSQ